MATVPEAPTLGEPTQTTVPLVGLPADGNPGGTQYAIYNVTTGAFVAADGAATGQPVWQTASAWAGVTIGAGEPLESDAEYGFQTMARNADGHMTPLGAISSARTLRETIPPTVLKITDGGSVHIEFSEAVMLSMKDINITYDGGQPVDLTGVALQHEPGSTSAVLAGLSSGNYTLTLSGNSVQDLAANLLDGDDDGSAGGDYVADFAVVDQPPTITAWYSAAEHDVTESLLGISDDGLFSESREDGIRRLVLEFSEEVDLSGASVAITGNGVGNAPVDLAGITPVLASAGSTVSISFREALLDEALPDMARYAVRVEGITDLAGNALAGDNDRTMTALCGDVNGDLKTDVFDLRFAWDYRGQVANGGSAQARADMNQDGTVSTLDMLLAWDHRGHDTSVLDDPVPPAAASQAAEALFQTYATSSGEQTAGGISATSSNVQGLASVVIVPVPTSLLATSTAKPQASAATPDTPLATVSIVPAILAETSSQAGLAPVATPASAGLWLLPASSDPSVPMAELEPSLDTDLTDILGERLDLVLPAR